MTYTREHILENAKWNKATVSIDQLTFVGPDGFTISAVRSKEGQTRREVEDNLVDAVQDRYN